MNINMKKLKGNLIRGTLLLTIAGFITRIIGFFYRVFLADYLGETLLGIYQLIFPIYGITFTIYAAGIQTAISQMIASNTESPADREKKNRKILKYGLFLSLSLAFLLTLLVFIFSDKIADYFLLEPSCKPYLQILCLLFPFCGTSACINGYFYGKKQAKVPAITQIIEQLARVGFVMFLCIFLDARGTSGCRIAVSGIVIGEFVSCIYNCLKLAQEFPSVFAWRKRKTEETKKRERLHHVSDLSGTRKSLFSSLLFLAGTLTSTKLILALLHSVEAVFIPAALKQYGYSSEEALAVFGVFSGIALPFILFPSTVTNSFAVMLLPSIAESHASGRTDRIHAYVTKSGKYSLLIGYVFTALFLIFGNTFGTVLFHSADAGYFITMLSWICPFLYLSTTLTSIINGLGKTQLTFFITTVSLGIKIFFLIALVPLHGIKAYLIGTLFSQIIMTVWEAVYLRKYIDFSAKKFILLPALLLMGLGVFLEKIYF